MVLDRLSPTERVAFVLHDTFGYGFDIIAELLQINPAAARKSASRARSKIRHSTGADRLADWEIVDAFMAAARGGEFDRLLQLLAPDATVTADTAALALGTPARIAGAEQIAGFFNGAAQAALPVFADGRPGAAWYDRGRLRVLFDFTLVDGQVSKITFRAAPEVLERVNRRRDDTAH